MSLNPFVGWSITTLLIWMLGKNNNDADKQTQDPEALSITETQAGTPVSLVMGRTILKDPLVIYYGDFSSEPYTEEYAAHADFSAWPIILTGLLQWLLRPKTGTTATPETAAKDGLHDHGPYAPPRAHSHATKEEEGPKFLLQLAQWLLSWLINGRNLKTTIQKGFKYHLGYQMLACLSGDNIKVRAIYLGQNKVWESSSPSSYPFVVAVNDENLFGGFDEGGGFQGEIHVYPGGKTQSADPWMIAQMNQSTISEELRGLTPAYRPYVSLVVPTSYVGKRATIPETWLDIQWIPNRLGLGAIGEDANPAEIIYELHVNEDWGLKESPDILDTDSLIAVGKKLKEENLGLTVVISQQKMQAREVIDAICDHINMARYIDPQTGKLTFKLIRDDYDVNTLPLLDETSCENVSFSRLTWTETSAEITVVYTDRAAQYEQSSIMVNDPANIEINAGTHNTKSYNFLYFTTAENALWAAQRERRQQGYPLASATIMGNRKLSSIRTGDVIKLNWSPYGVSNLLMRVTDVDLGDYLAGKVKLECIEDVFGLDKSHYGFSGSTDWTPPRNYPSGVQIFRYLEMPWEITRVDDSFVYAMAQRPDSHTLKWTVWRDRGAGWESTSSMTSWTPTAQLIYDYSERGEVEDLVGIEIADLGGVAELAATLSGTSALDVTPARRGSRVILVNNEIMAWSNLRSLSNGHWKLEGIVRGVFDTVPADHRQSDLIYFLDTRYCANVTTGGAVCPATTATQESYNITTSSATDDETFDNNKVKSLTTQRRSERPNPPGRIRLSDRLNLEKNYLDSVTGDLRLTWIVRNKQFSFGCVSQDDSHEYWTGSAFSPPDQMSNIVRIYSGSAKIAEHVLAGNISDFTYKWSDRCNDDLNLGQETVIEITSLLGALESYQSQRRSFLWAIPHMVDGCAAEEDAAAKLTSWANADEVVIPAGPLSEEKHLNYSADSPIILLGTRYDSQVADSIPCQDGQWIVPDGRAILINSRDSTEVSTMDAGFVVASYFIVPASGGIVYYQWDGLKMNPISIG